MRISLDIAAAKRVLDPRGRAAAAANLADLKQWLAQRASFIGGAASAGNFAPLWELVRQLSGRRSRRGLQVLAVLTRADGSVANTPLQVSQAWADLFCEDFGAGARVVSEEELKARITAARSLQVRQHTPPP